MVEQLYNILEAFWDFLGAKVFRIFNFCIYHKWCPSKTLPIVIEELGNKMQPNHVFC
jgi:hypothetical protein